MSATSTDKHGVKPDGSARDADRPSEDNIARAKLGGPRGAPELKPAKMTPQRQKKTPRDLDPGHTS
jgi:hypothetical protein